MSSWIDVVNKECSWIKIYYGVLADLVKEKGYTDVVEIGVAYGGHADDLLSNSQCKYTGIDPYQASYDPKDFFDKDVHRILGGKNKQHSMDLLYEKVLDRLARFGERCEIIRRKSCDAALFLDDEAYDVVFIDGNHMYDPVRTDINLYWPKIRKGGMMIGDDYDWPDVKRAVNEFGRENGLTVKRMKNNQGKLIHWYFEKSV